MYPSQQNATDYSANFFWLLVLICLGLLGIWYLKPAWIVEPVFSFRLIELNALIFLSHIWNNIAYLLHLPAVPMDTLLALKSKIIHDNPQTLHFRQFEAINLTIGHGLRWPVIATLFILAIIAYFRHATMVFRQRYNVNSLKEAESDNWPQIQPVLSLNLVKQDLEQGPWAMAKTPLDYCKEQGIVALGEKNKKTIWMINKGAAMRLFTMQLGPLWKDLFNLPIHIKALIVIFIARAQRDRAVAKRFLSQIARSAASGQLDFSGVSEQLVNYRDSKILKWLDLRHAYVRTMMATLLEIARADGILATAEFLWLKPVDRKLWYILNCVGRQTAFIEVSGIFAHWKAEQSLGRAMTTPMVTEAVKALDLCIQDILYVSSDEKWHSNAV